MCPSAKGGSDPVGGSSGRLVIPARIVVRSDPLADFQDGEHSPHFNGTELAVSHHHGERIFRADHHFAHFGHVAHPVVSHGHVTGDQPAHLLIQAGNVHSDHIRILVAHGIHGVMVLVAMECPVAGIVGYEFDGAGGAGRDIHRGLRPPGGFWNWASVRLHYPPAVAVEMDGMAVHAEIGETYPDAVAFPYHQGSGSREDPAVEGEKIEVGHDHGIDRI